MSALCSIPDCGRSLRARTYCTAHWKRWRKYGSPLGEAPKTETHLGWLKQQTQSVTDQCILWPFRSLIMGYGAVWVNGEYKGAHRVICQLVHGEHPTDRHEAAHGCGNPLCVNPRHLRWATRAENNADRLLHGTHNLGEQNSNALLTREDVEIIRASREPRRMLAARFGVSASTIGNVRGKRAWTWLP